MDKSTLSNYGWIVAVVVVLAIMFSLATPFGQVIRGNVESQVTKLQDTADGALDAAGGASSFDDLSGGGSGGGAGGSGGTGSNLIPVGAVYTVEATRAVLTGDNGDSFPEAPADYDTYEEGDYKYYYGDDEAGWAVLVKDTTKAAYGEIRSEIAGKPIVNMWTTFQNCTSLTVAPAIPNSVNEMFATFRDCTSLTTVPALPSSLTNMYGTFKDCTSLTTVPTLPSSLTNMEYAFSGCTSLTGIIEIPDSVTDMFCAFENCTSLITAPTLPSSVTDIGGTFSGCTSLTGTIEINANPTYYEDCLKNTQITEVTGSTTLAAEILATK